MNCSSQIRLAPLKLRTHYFHFYTTGTLIHYLDNKRKNKILYINIYIFDLRTKRKVHTTFDRRIVFM